MAIDKKFIHFKTYDNFISHNGIGSEANITTPTEGSEDTGDAIYGQIKGSSVVFIKDVQKMWTHGQLYDCTDVSDELVDIKSSLSIVESDYITTSALKNYVDGKVFVGTEDEYKVMQDKGAIGIGSLVIILDENEMETSEVTALLGTAILGKMLLGTN